MNSRRFITTSSRAEADIFNIQNDSTPRPRGMGDNSRCSHPSGWPANDRFCALALNGPASRRDRCLLIEVKQTWRNRRSWSVFDPNRTFGTQKKLIAGRVL